MAEHEVVVCDNCGKEVAETDLVQRSAKTGKRGRPHMRKIAGAVVKISPPASQVSPEAEQAAKQFVSEGLSAGDVLDIFELTGEDRPEISILSDEFLDKVAKGLAAPIVGIELLKRILRDEIRVRSRSNAVQAKLFGDELRETLERYDARHISGDEVIKRLIELARKMREARRRHEELGLTVEEVAFYDALAGSSEDWTADPKLAEVAQALVSGIKGDLTVDWADHESTEAAIRVRIKRLLRRYRYEPPKGGGGPNVERVVDLVLDQARALYRWWPDVAPDLPI